LPRSCHHPRDNRTSATRDAASIAHARARLPSLPCDERRGTEDAVPPSANDDEDDLTSTAVVTSHQTRMAVRGCAVTVTEGPDAGARFLLEDVTTQRVLVGQSAVCAVQLKDPAVSRRHAALEGEGGAVRIVDLGSSNGTFVNEVRIRDAYLRGGDSIRVGSSKLRVDLDADAHTVTTPALTRFHSVIGSSPAMQRLYPVFSQLAASDVAVLIEGETGTGKEVLAESLHQASDRKHGPFVVLDCAAVSPTLLDAELFGNERGAFTGALAARRGLFEEAHGGTLFVDEIGDLDVSLQAKLLRAIEKKQVRRLGSNELKRVDVRIIAATRRDLDREVQAGRFRDDLFYRLAVARVELPPLRRREGDVPALAGFFWTALGGVGSALPPGLLERFEGYEWPGNVRELHNAVARQLAMGDVVLGAEPVEGTPEGDFLDRVVLEGKPLPMARQQVVDEFQRRYLTRMLALHGGRAAEAAAACGIGLRYFQMLRAKT
jgi:transcriptional regulator with PAS, ATPase and Fis domain